MKWNRLEFVPINIVDVNMMGAVSKWREVVRKSVNKDIFYWGPGLSQFVQLVLVPKEVLCCGI